MQSTYKHREYTLALRRFLMYASVLRTVKNPKRMRQMWVRTQRSIGVNHD